MRTRILKPGFFSDDSLAELDPLTRILFAGLWCVADRNGRLEDRPKRIKVEVLPYDDADVDALLNELAEAGFIVRYTACKRDVIWIPSFLKHQKPHSRESASDLPELPKHDLGSDEAQPRSPVSVSISDSVSVSQPPPSPSDFPDCMRGDEWKRGDGDFMSSFAHIVAAIERKTGNLATPQELGMVGHAIKSTCPKGCKKDSPEVCAQKMIACLERAFTVRKACDFYIADRKGA